MKKYNAFSEVEVTDGVTTFYRRNFDLTKNITKDDMAACHKAASLDNIPETISSMKEKISTAIQDRSKSKNARPLTPAMELNIKDFDSILAGINFDDLNKTDLITLNSAYESFHHIMAIIQVDMAANHSSSQRKKAQASRSIIREIKEHLVSQYPDYTAKELWPHLYAELERRELDPEENDDVPGAEVYTYDQKDGRKTISFRTFANITVNE